MTAAVAKILEEVKNLSTNEREEFRHEIADLFSNEADDDFTPEELAAIDAGIERGEADFAAGCFSNAEDVFKRLEARIAQAKAASATR